MMLMKYDLHCMFLAPFSGFSSMHKLTFSKLYSSSSHKLVKYIFRLGKNTRTVDIVQIIDANVWTSYILLSSTTTVVLLLVGALVY